MKQVLRRLVRVNHQNLWSDGEGLGAGGGSSDDGGGALDADVDVLVVGGGALDAAGGAPDADEPGATGAPAGAAGGGGGVRGAAVASLAASGWALDANDGDVLEAGGGALDFRQRGTTFVGSWVASPAVNSPSDDD